MAENWENITISHILTFEDFKKSFYRNYFSKTWMKIFYIFGPIVILLCFSYVISSLIIGFFDEMLFISFFIIFLGIFCLVMLFRPLFLLSQIKKIWYETNKTPKQYDWLLTKDRVIITRLLSQFSFAWNFVAKIIENEEYFFFFLNSQVNYLIPKRAMSDIETQQLRKLISNVTSQYNIPIELAGM